MRIAIMLVMLTLMCFVVGCQSINSTPLASPSGDMLVPPAALQEATDAESFGDVMEYNNGVLLEDRDKLIRWQEWWKGREGGGK